MVPWFHMMDKLEDLDHDKALDASSDDETGKALSEAPWATQYIPVSASDLRLPIFNWEDSRMKNHEKPSCTSRGCIVKTYRKLWKRHSRGYEGWNDKFENEIRKVIKAIQQKQPYRYDGVQVVVNII